MKKQKTPKLPKKTSKIKRSTKSKPEYNGIVFDSTLEIYCYKKLIEAKIKFEYHPISFELFPKFESTIDSYEPDKRKGDSLYLKTKKFQSIKYTPDFIGKGWVIETKGLLRPREELVIKLFKRKLSLDNITCDYYLPKNHKQVDKCIELILNKK